MHTRLQRSGTMRITQARKYKMRDLPLSAHDGAITNHNAHAHHRLANKLYLKTADIAALAGDYYKSIGLYERVARASVDNNLMRWSVKDYLLKAGICHLATKVCSAQCSTPAKQGRIQKLIEPCLGVV